MDSSSDPGSSLSAFVSALVFNGVIFAIFVGIFLVIRNKLKDFYQKRAYSNAIPEKLRVEPLSSNPFTWIKTVYSLPDKYLLNKLGLDAYFFLRYLRFAAMVAIAGCILLFPILFPVNATGGAGQKGLDILSFSNISEPNRSRYYAHVFLGWIFYWGFLFLIYRELTFYTSLRQAVLTSPFYSTRLSQRVVLFQSVPEKYLSVEAFSRMFRGVRHVWINRDVSELEDDVKEREKLAYKLEAAETKLLKIAMKKARKSDVAGTNIDDYVPPKKRPMHRLKFLIGEKVDTINYARETLAEFDEKISLEQLQYNELPTLNSVFVEFESQDYAQSAYQSLSCEKPRFMTPRYTGIVPSTIIWKNLKTRWYQMFVQNIVTNAIIVFLVIFWAIPVAFVGALSNLTYLTDKVTFLRFILNMPHFLYGLVTALLPTILLAILMMLLPIILRKCAIYQGAPTTALVEYKVQGSYFAFQVVQVFIVVTLTSSATSVVTQIISDPSSATSLLASNLPKASNFFICYIILQGLTVAGGSLLSYVGLILYKVMGFILDSTPRKKWARLNVVGSTAWGTVFPIYTNLFVIAMSYSLISPLILIFLAGAFVVLYLAYCYNLVYNSVPGLDLQGLHYPRALYQSLTGVYLGNVCMLGLVSVGKNWGCIVLQVVNLVVVIFVHIYMKNSFAPLLEAVPKSLNLSKKGISSKATADMSPLPKVVDSESEETDMMQGYKTETGSETDGKTMTLLQKFIRPDLAYSVDRLRYLMPQLLEPVSVTPDQAEGAYQNPAITAKAPFLWIPRDPRGLSAIEVQKSSAVIGISDEGAEIDEKGNIVSYGLPPEYAEPPVF
ncbi:hypothetical protein CANCADRAFT_112342 [Tortispora caseinolytica NRRL Y-17796]|uniref:DUF221 domain-containing protein n=1 Tax=Tortispora caseinolytica NRRL Y-17796 TaxID=767744 RepID=A0A1E4TGF8_9ASCO|nr:hypothetical protein CANCADRAFT_112342 [Tortispora caseinolytica NRRL Y-17796]